MPQMKGILPSSSGDREAAPEGSGRLKRKQQKFGQQASQILKLAWRHGFSLQTQGDFRAIGRSFKGLMHIPTELDKVHELWGLRVIRLKPKSSDIQNAVTVQIEQIRSIKMWKPDVLELRKKTHS